MGAMENAGAVTLRDEYLPRSRQDALVLRVPGHGDPARDGAHVVRRPGHDEVVGRPVAQRVVRRVGLLPRRRRGHRVHRGLDRLRQRPQELGAAPGPAAEHPPDRRRQLRPAAPWRSTSTGSPTPRAPRCSSSSSRGSGWRTSWSGCAPTSRRTPSATPSSPTCSARSSSSSGRELDSWAKEWLQTSGVNTLAPRFELGADGTYTSFAVEQTATVEHPTLRRHRLGIGLYDARREAGRLMRRTPPRGGRRGRRSPRSTQLVGVRQPDLLLLNDGDLTYAKIRLDERSLETVVGGLSRLDDSLARALCWGAAWDMTRDAEMSATDFVTLVLGNIAAETDAFGSSRIPGYAAQAVNSLSAPANRAALRATWESGLRRLLEEAAPGSDHQLTFARAVRRGGAHRRGARPAREPARRQPSPSTGSPSTPTCAGACSTVWPAPAAPTRSGSPRSCDATTRSPARSAPPRHAPRGPPPRPRPRRGRWRWSATTSPTRPSAASCSRSCSRARTTCSRRTSTGTSTPPHDAVGARRAPSGPRRRWSSSVPASARLARAARPGRTRGCATPTANPAAKRYVHEGAADVERFLRAQAQGRRQADRRWERVSACRVSGLRAASASWPTPCLIPPTRSPPEKADSMPATASRTDSVAQRAAYDGAGHHLDQPGSRGRRGSSTLRSGEASDACSRCAKGCDSPLAAPT